MATLPHSLTVRFPHLASANYPVAVELARASPGYRETGIKVDALE